MQARGRRTPGFAAVAAALLALVATPTLPACGADGVALSVELRTDMVPGREFYGVRVALEAGADRRAQDRIASRGDDYARSARVADFDGVRPGEVRLRVTLLDAEGEALVERLAVVRLSGSYVVTVVVTRSCEGVTCPADGADPGLDTCIGGRCQASGCTPETPARCERECDADRDCRAEVACLAPVCRDGTCLFVAVDARCGAGELCNPYAGCVPATGLPPVDGGAGDAGPACEPAGPAETACDDGRDDDCDGRVDCLDEDCDGRPCDDRDACTTGEVCGARACGGGGPRACDDGDACTDDDCDPASGCVHPYNTAPCEDGDRCTAGDTCREGRCLPGMAVDCDDGDPCTTDGCDAATGCTRAPSSEPCDDDVFCNGADRCADGTCSVHAGSPCMAFCDEALDRCTTCRTDADCGAVSFGAWSACGGFSDTCDETGTQSRAVTTPRCDAGGTCVNTVATETRACTRSTAGVACRATVTGAWGPCGGFSNACDTTGTQSRPVTTYTCGAGTCNGATSTQSQACTRTVANGTSCGSNSYCCSGSCVARNDRQHCSACGVVCPSGTSCASHRAGQYSCSCSSNAQCQSAGFGASATCYNPGSGAFCNCQCPSGTSCTGQCRGGATCHDVSGHNYCAY